MSIVYNGNPVKVLNYKRAGESDTRPYDSIFVVPDTSFAFSGGVTVNAGEEKTIVTVSDARVKASVRVYYFEDGSVYFDASAQRPFSPPSYITVYRNEGDEESLTITGSDGTGTGAQEGITFWRDPGTLGELAYIFNTGKNLLGYTLESLKAINVNGTWSGNEYTYRGVTFTVNDDGSITANGKCTAWMWFGLCELDSSKIVETIMSGCPNNGSINTYTVSALNLDDNNYTYFDEGNGCFLHAIPNGRYRIRITINTNYTAESFTFYPMIRYAAVEDDTYEPYGKKYTSPVCDALATFFVGDDAYVHKTGDYYYDQEGTSIAGELRWTGWDLQYRTSEEDEWTTFETNAQFDKTVGYYDSILRAIPSVGPGENLYLRAVRHDVEGLNEDIEIPDDNPDELVPV